MSLVWLGEMNKKRRASGGIGQAVDLACVVAAGSSDTLINGPPFASTAEWWPLMRVESIATDATRAFPYSVSITPPSTRTEAPVVADACGDAR